MGGTSTTTPTTTEPWQPTQDALLSNVGSAKSLVENQVGYNPASFDLLYTPQNWWTQQGQVGLGNVAARGDELGQNAYGANNALAASGGIQNWQQPALQSLSNIATGANGINTGGQYQQLANSPGIDASGMYNLYGQIQGTPGANQQNLGGIAGGAEGINASDLYNLYGQSQGNAGAAQRYLTDSASGKFLDPQNDPYYSKALDIESQRTGDQANRAFSNMGRYGSDVHERGVTEAIGNVRTNALANQFARNQALQQQSVGQISAEELANRGQQAGILGQIMGAQGQNIANRMGASGQIGQEQLARTGQQAGLLGQIAGAQGQNYGNQLQAIQGLTQTQGANLANQAGAAQGINQAAGQTANILGNLGQNASTLYGNLANPARLALETGKIGEGYDTQMRQSLLDIYNQGQQAPWQRLSAANAIYGLGGSLGQFNTKTSTVPGNANGVGDLLGSLFRLPGMLGFGG
jgi:hypothetical protein